MTFEKGLIRIRAGITNGKIATLDHVFRFVTKSEVSRRTGIDYQRVLDIVNNPFMVEPDEANKIIDALQITGIEFIKLIYRAM